MGIGEKMRINPKYSSVCWNRIGAYRSTQCVDGPRPCVHLSECELHHCEDTGDWDYTHPLEIRQHKQRVRKIKNKRGRGARLKSKIEEGHRTYLVKIGKASRIPIRTTLNEALAKAGLM
jgi:hypothetical protein